MGFMAKLFSDKQAVKKFEQSLLHLEQTLSEFGLPKGSNSLPTIKGPTSQNKKKKLCFYCKGSYDANHDCLLRPKGKANRIMWAPYEDSEPEKSNQKSNHEESKSEHEISTGEVSESLFDVFGLKRNKLADHDLQPTGGHGIETEVVIGKEILHHDNSMVEPQNGIHNIPKVVISTANSSDFHDSSDKTLQQHETAVISHVQNDSIELSQEGTQDLGTNGSMCDLDSCYDESDFSNQTLKNKFDDSCVGIESQDRELDRLAITSEAEVCENNVKTAASTLPVEPSSEVHSSNTLEIVVCTVDCTHDVACQEMSDVDTASYHSANFDLESLHGSLKFQRSHHSVGQLKVNDNMIALALEHFDVAR